MTSGLVPAKLDIPAMLDDLNTAGLTDNRVEAACDFSVGYVAKLRSGEIKRLSYEYGARLLNLWADLTSASTAQTQ